MILGSRDCLYPWSPQTAGKVLTEIPYETRYFGFPLAGCVSIVSFGMERHFDCRVVHSCKFEGARERKKHMVTITGLNLRLSPKFYSRFH